MNRAQTTACFAVIIVAIGATPKLAGAQTPLLDRYSSYLATPFRQGLDPRVFGLPPGERLPLDFIGDVLDPVYLNRDRDRSRIKRVAQGLGAASGFEDASGDGRVTTEDLDALDSFLLAKVRELGAGYSDDELEIPRPLDLSLVEGRYREVHIAVEVREQECIELGCDMDGDGVDDFDDLCIEDANPMQTDRDGDGFGDACDLDSDNNAIPDRLEDCTRQAEGVAACVDLIDELRAMLLVAQDPLGRPRPPARVIDALVVKIDQAARLIAAGRLTAAAGLLRAFAQHARAQSGKALLPGVAELLASSAERLASGLR